MVGRRHVHEKGNQNSDQAHTTSEGEVFPWVEGGDVAVREGEEGVGEDVDE